MRLSDTTSEMVTGEQRLSAVLACTPLPRALCGIVNAYVGSGVVFFIGGLGSADAAMYDRGSEQWISLATMQQTRELPCATASETCLFVCGGHQGADSDTDSCERLDFALPLSQWQAMPSLPEALSAR